MKNLILIALILFSFNAASAQGKSNKNMKHSGKGENKKYEKNDNNQTGIFNDNDRNNQNVKYTKNAPSKVRDSFTRDFPGINNPQWTKSQGVWTANYRRGGIFGGGGYVSYKANGQRVN